jgi:hypothetical protein
MVAKHSPHALTFHSSQPHFIGKPVARHEVPQDQEPHANAAPLRVHYDLVLPVQRLYGVGSL